MSKIVTFSPRVSAFLFLSLRWKTLQSFPLPVLRSCRQFGGGVCHFCWPADERCAASSFSEQKAQPQTSTTIFLWMSNPPTTCRRREVMSARRHWLTGFCFLPLRLTAQNSSKDILPSPSLSALMMVLSTICWSCVSFRLLPTIIFRTWNNSPLDM